MSVRSTVLHALVACLPVSAAAQMTPHHEMFSTTFAGGWRAVGMAQAFPIYSTSWSGAGGTPLDDGAVYLTQPAAMVNLESPSRRFTLRLTPNFEGLTIEDGELTLGAWGEGFIDARHPHTLLHEAMVSLNLFEAGGGGLSISAGKGFAPYGTDDPMSRPSVKYPTNHHLSQILERFTVNAVWLTGGWGLEAGVFGGSEPDGPYDFSNIESFGDSWSARVSRRISPLGLEVSASHARVIDGHGDGGHEHGTEAHDDDEDSATTALYNGALRWDSTVREGSRLYGLVEYSWSDPADEDEEGYWSFLAEAQWSSGRHTPYVRFERSIRPEFPRDGADGSGFFRYDHDVEAIGATAWSITSLGYGYTATRGPVSIRPFVEGQIFGVAGERGGIVAGDLMGDDRFGAVTLGARVYFGGDPMRMGSYGVLDPMTQMGRSMTMGMSMDDMR